MKLHTALLAGIGLIGGACLLPLPAGAQTSPANSAAGPTAPGTNNSGAIHTPTNTGSTAGTSGMSAPSGSSTMGSTTSPSSSTMGSASGTTGNYGASGSTTMGSNTNMGSDDVSKLQQALNDNGENVKVDGVMGPATENALKDYQQKNGLQASGQLDTQTRQKLNLGG